MLLDTKPLDEIKESDLHQLIADASPEKKTIDYKRDLVGGTDTDKKEFLADISSFANASGGYLILGMDEDNGVPVDLCGLKISDPDAEILRVENLIRDGIAPRILGIETVAVSIASKGTCALVVRVPRSWQSPHMVTFKGSSRFYSRTSNGKYPLDVGEIRTAFMLSETAIERIRLFRTDRINQIVSGETSISMQEGPKAILHLVPLDAFAPGNSVNLNTLLANGASELHRRTEQLSFSGKRLNFDGLLIYPAGSTAKYRQYVQIFRNGCVEFVTAVSDYGDNRNIEGAWFESPLIDGFADLLSILSFLSVQVPVFAMLTIVNVRGYTIIMGRHSMMYIDRESIYPVDRDHLIVPEIVIENLQSNADEMLRPSFDAIWNASGWAASRSYDANGKWNPQ